MVGIPLGKIGGVSLWAPPLPQRNFSELGLPVSLKDMASTVAGRSNDGDAPGDRASPVLSEPIAVNPSRLCPIREVFSLLRLAKGLAATILWQLISITIHLILS